MNRSLTEEGKPDAAVRWKIQLFGQLRAETEDRVVARFPTQKSAALLAYLAYHLERPHPREKLIDLLWPDVELDSGRNSFNVALSSLRQRLGGPEPEEPSVLLADRSMAQLDPEWVSTDVLEFDTALPHRHATRPVWSNQA